MDYICSFYFCCFVFFYLCHGERCMLFWFVDRIGWCRWIDFVYFCLWPLLLFVRRLSDLWKWSLFRIQHKQCFEKKLVKLVHLTIIYTTEWDETLDGLLKRIENTMSTFAFHIWRTIFVWYFERISIELPGRIFSYAIRSAVSTVSILADATRLLFGIFHCCCLGCSCLTRWALNWRCGRKIATRFRFNMPIVHFHVYDFHEFDSCSELLDFLLWKQNRSAWVLVSRVRLKLIF